MSVKKKTSTPRVTKNGKRVGRPPGAKSIWTTGSERYHKAVCKIVTDFLKKGYSRQVISAHLGIHYNTLARWEKEHPELQEAIAEGMVYSQLWWETLGIKAAQGRVKNFNASAWIFNMKNRFGWKDKTELSGDEDKPISVRVVKFSDMQKTQEKVLEPEWRKIDNLKPSEDVDMDKALQ